MGKTVASLVDHLIKTAEVAEQRVADSVKQFDTHLGWLSSRTTEWANMAKEIVVHAEWIRSDACVTKLGKDLASAVQPLLRETTERLCTTAGDLKVESQNLAAESFAREERFLRRIEFLEKSDRIRENESAAKPVRFSVASAILVITGTIVIGVIIGVTVTRLC